jgi:uncharacterized protein YbjT (DUF2867 family)
MRILVVGPTGRTGSHVVDALRRRDPEVSIRGFCRYPETRSRPIETIPGDARGAVAFSRPIETIPGDARTAAAFSRPIETIPGDARSAVAFSRPIETIPGDARSAVALSRPIETIPGDARSAVAFSRPIETIPGDARSAVALSRPIETIPGDARSAVAFSRPIETIPGDARSLSSHRIDCVIGDLENPADRTSAVESVDTVIHYAPAFHPREAAMGTGMIDAAVAAGVRRFIYVSALHAQVDTVPGNAAKLAVESYLASTELAWTIVRPQRYMQNIDVPAVLAAGTLDLPVPLPTPQGHLDLVDLGEVLATIALEDGHALATYDIANDEALSTAEIAALIASIGGQAVAPGELATAQLVAGLEAAGPAYAYVADAMGLLATWQARTGGRGNANCLRWLLGREPGRFDAYVRRSLAAVPHALVEAAPIATA